VHFANFSGRHLAWFGLIDQQFISFALRAFWIAIAAGIAWAVLAFIVFLRLSDNSAWSRRHIFAATFGATLACIAAPYLSISSWTKIDTIGVVAFNILALAVFALLGKKISLRSESRVGWPPKHYFGLNCGTRKR
jgi:Mg/Co/Ni transporter MgtE